MLGSTATIIMPPFQIAYSQNSTSTSTTPVNNGALEPAIISGQFIVSYKDPGELAQAGMAADDPNTVLTESLEAQGIDASINKSLPALNSAVVNVELPPESALAGQAAGDQQGAVDLVVRQLEQNPVVESAQADMKMSAIEPILNPNVTALSIQTIPSGIDRVDGETIPQSLETSNADIADSRHWR